MDRVCSCLLFVEYFSIVDNANLFSSPIRLGLIICVILFILDGILVNSLYVSNCPLEEEEASGHK